MKQTVLGLHLWLVSNENSPSNTFGQHRKLPQSNNDPRTTNHIIEKKRLPSLGLIRQYETLEIHWTLFFSLYKSFSQNTVIDHSVIDSESRGHSLAK